MKTIFFSILLSILVGVVVHKISTMLAMETIAEVVEENKNLKIDMQYNEGQVYSECQRMLQINAKIQKVDGCMRTVEILCNERTAQNAELCMKTFMPVCSRLDQ